MGGFWSGLAQVQHPPAVAQPVLEAHLKTPTATTSVVVIDHCFSPELAEFSAVHGGWSSWSFWGSCKPEYLSIKPDTDSRPESGNCVEIQKGKRSRHRLCSSPSPSCSGKYCSGDHIEFQSCWYAQQSSSLNRPAIICQWLVFKTPSKINQIKWQWYQF